MNSMVIAEMYPDLAQVRYNLPVEQRSEQQLRTIARQVMGLNANNQISTPLGVRVNYLSGDILVQFDANDGEAANREHEVVLSTISVELEASGVSLSPPYIIANQTIAKPENRQLKYIYSDKLATYPNDSIARQSLSAVPGVVRAWKREGRYELMVWSHRDLEVQEAINTMSQHPDLKDSATE